MIIIMNNIKVYKYILLILMILILISGGFALTKPDLLKQIKVVIFWYLLILELNLLNIYSVLSFYERNKNRKGPRGVKGIVGSRGLKGKSILCQSCNTAGSSSSNNKFAKTNGIMNDNVKAGRCIFPFLDKYIYRYDVAPITSTLPENMNLNIPTSVYPNGWCATSVNNQFEPVTIGFYDESLATQLANEAELDRMRSMYYQSNYGILDIQVVMGNTLREAKNVFSRKYEKQGYTFYDNDVNEGTGGKFIYFCVKKGVASKGVVDMKIKYNPGQLTTPDNRLNQQGNSVSGSLDYEIVNSSVDPANLNTDSRNTDPGDQHSIFLYLKKGSSGFIKDIKIIFKNSLENGMTPEGYGPVTKFGGDGSNRADLNQGTYPTGGAINELLLLKQETFNIISIDTAFVFTDNSLYLFISNKFYKFTNKALNNRLKVLENYPKPIQSKWGRVPSLKSNTNEFAIEADKCRDYNGDNDKCDNTTNCFYDRLSNTCEPLRVYDAVYVNQQSETFFFKGQFVYKYNSREQKIEAGFPKLATQLYPGFPNNIDAIFLWKKDFNTYIFKGNMYYKLDPATQKVDRGYPKKSNIRWPGMPDIINAIFTLPYFITRMDGKPTPSGNNHTYVISQEQVYYIDPITDIVDEQPAGNINDVFEGLTSLSDTLQTSNLIQSN